MGNTQIACGTLPECTAAAGGTFLCTAPTMPNPSAECPPVHPVCTGIPYGPNPATHLCQ
jgi:hypothetical protein